LVKVISPPPVTRRQLPEIVAYEAKQQIPFDLSQVQWRSLFAGEHAFEGEFFMSGDVILTAVKNDDVQSSLKPLGELRDRVDLVTNRTLVRADLGRILLAQKPEATIALVEMHSEKTSLIVINQGKLWTRDIPIGGNHFTRQVCKELKLTFAKAEYLKLHAMEAEDPKVVFQSVRSVFEELVAEISKSLGFWKSVSAGKSIDKLFVTGGPSGLPGLTPYLEKNLQIPVEGFSFENFPLDDLGENDAKFVMPCLLAAQRLGYGMYRTNFIPYSSGFGLGAKAAWGIEIGQAGITAVKLLLKS
jgi:type IV pilus assembly protein PilM